MKYKPSYAVRNGILYIHFQGTPVASCRAVPPDTAYCLLRFWTAALLGFTALRSIPSSGSGESPCIYTELQPMSREIFRQRWNHGVSRHKHSPMRRPCQLGWVGYDEGHHSQAAVAAILQPGGKWNRPLLLKEKPSILSRKRLHFSSGIFAA